LADRPAEEEALGEFLDAASSAPSALLVAAGARCRAMVLAARGDVDAAVQSVRRALTEHDRLPMRRQG
jgi:hypothetical protein